MGPDPDVIRRLGHAVLTTMLVAAAPLPPNDGTMTIRGRFLYTAAGERVVLRGVNEMFSISTDPTGVRTMPEIARTGANAVRIFTLPDYSAERLDAILAHAVANGLIPIVECHAATGKWDRLGVCVGYWTRPDIVAVLRRNRRWTLVNIANEAGETVSRDRFIAGYLDAIIRIRAAGVDTPLIIDGTDWGKEYAMLLDSWPVFQRADPRHAIMVSAHSYWVGTEEQRKKPYRAIIAKVTRDNIPFLLGEGPTGTGWDCKPSPYRWAMTALQKAQIGWLAWSWGLVPNGDCREANSYDITSGGRFGQWKSPYGRQLMVRHPASVRRSSRRPCSISRAWSNCIAASSRTSGTT